MYICVVGAMDVCVCLIPGEDVVSCVPLEVPLPSSCQPWLASTGLKSCACAASCVWYCSLLYWWSPYPGKLSQAGR